MDDGKSWYSEGSCIRVIYLNRGGSLREGRARDSPRAEVGGFFCWGHVGTFFAFFSHLVLTSIFHRFFFDFGEVLEAKMAPQINFWRAFWDAFLAPSFFMDFALIFMLFLKSRPLKLLIFPTEN